MSKTKRAMELLDQIPTRMVDEYRIFDRIVEWNTDRNIPKEFLLAKEAGNISEELAELLRANTDEELIDALCDIIVFSVGAINKLGYKPTDVMDETLKEIEDRDGSFNVATGKWHKVSNKKTRYKAKYVKDN